jgi:Outer membrane protein beta-barrel domain
LQLKPIPFLVPVALFLSVLAASVQAAHAQAVPTASANIQLSAFAGVSANYTGVELARNGDVTAGVDIGFRPFAGFFPGLEARGSYPIAKGNLVNQENFLGGIRLGRRKGNFNPYGDVLFGRGKLNFPNGLSTPTNTFIVLSNTTNVLSFGGGLDYNLSQHFGVKGDFQFQKYDTPVAASGSVFSKVFTAGITYRFASGKIR